MDSNLDFGLITVGLGFNETAAVNFKTPQNVNHEDGVVDKFRVCAYIEF